MNPIQHNSPPSAQPEITPAVAMQARRKMLRRSLALGTPVVATLASGPVAAGKCMVASSFVSAATFVSRNPAGNPCAGKSPAQWLAATSWSTAPFNAVVNKNSIMFNNRLGVGGAAYQIAGGPTMAAVLTADITSLASHLVALWLNARAGYGGTIFLGTVPSTGTANEANKIWENIVNNGGQTAGGYLPAGGLTPRLSTADTKAWLALTWAP